MKGNVMAIDTTKLRNPALREFSDEHLNYAARFVPMGTPIVADDDKVVVSADMKVGAYTIAAQPDVPRNITVTVTAGGTADTMGTITVTGTNVLGQVISEVITPIAGTPVAGKKAFKTVTSVVGAGWVVDAVESTKDTIKVGIGTALGLPIKVATGDCLLSVLGTSFVVPTLATGNVVESCTIDSSSGTYNGSKALYAIVVE